MPGIEDIPKKIQIAAAWTLDRDFYKSRASEALDVSEEYIRQIVNDLESEGESEKFSEGELERARSDDVQGAVFHVMHENGAFRGLPDYEGEQKIEIPLADVEQEMERLSYLQESAEEGGDQERAFVARSAREFLDQHVENSTH